jgi:intracellular proteinase inhibitor BsuPI
VQGAGGRGSGVRLRLLTPAQVRQGEPLRFTLRIENAGRRPATVYLQGRPPAFDVTVHDASGREVWRRLEGAVVAMVLGVRELAPEESFELEGLWPQTDAGGAQVAAGRYRLTGLLPGEPGWDLRSPSVDVDILPAGGPA